MAAYEVYYDINSIEKMTTLIISCCKLDEQNNIKKIVDEKKLQESVIYTLQFNASVNQDFKLKKEAIAWINKIAIALKILSDSNYKYYLDKSKGNNMFATTPAINSRMLTFHTVRAALQSQINLKNPHIIFELALSEREYTDQKMDEYAALVKAAYISMGLKNCKFYLQGDHYQADPKKYTENPEKEMQRIKEFIKEAIENEVYNIDIDTSKFETDDPAKSDRDNQFFNAKLTAELLFFIRKIEQKRKLPCIISVGGEVGEVGGTNTKYPQVNAYLIMIKEMLEEQIKNDSKNDAAAGAEKKAEEKLNISKVKGLSKISINVGSAHGGQLGSDGKPLPDVPLDFTAHHDVYMKGDDPLNKRKHVLSVQHGASTLPKHYFSLFPAMHVAEIHLATGFQNITWNVLERNNQELYQKMKAAMFEKYSKQISEHKNEAIGFAKECKRITKFFKRDLLLMDSQVIAQIEKELQQEFLEIMHSLHTFFLPKGSNSVKGDRAD